MAEEKEFPQGIRFKRPHDNAPDFIKGQISIKVDELVAWLSDKEGWVNLDLKLSKKGNLYLEENTWKKEDKGGVDFTKKDDIDISDIPE